MEVIKIEFDLDGIRAAVKNYLESVKHARVLTFSGELGAGKTTFISKVCEQIGVMDVVNSPTFSIVQQYEYPGGNIYHMDLYRIRDEEEAANAGLVDCIESGDICLIEWPENAPGILPADVVHTLIQITGHRSRSITIKLPEPPM